MKYIMTSRGPIIFPDNFNHSDFKDIGPDIVLESAGVVSCDIGSSGLVYASAVGSSMSLGLSADEKKDSEALAMFVQNLLNGY